MPSNISSQTIKTTPMLFAGFSGFHDTKLRNEHTLFANPDAVRVNCLATPAGANGVSTVSFTKAAGAGDTIYLSYFPNEISSVRLTNPPPAGVTLFTTDNLSGCKFFVDRVTGSQDLIVYHSNARACSPPANRGAAYPRFETPTAATTLDGLHTRAVADWTGAPHALALANAGEVGKPTYNSGAELIVRRKDQQGRKRIPVAAEQADPQRVNKPEFIGGTVIFGFFGGAQWKFYYQTWGAVEYARPMSAPKRLLKGRDVMATNYRLVGYGQIFPGTYNRTL